jgi:hypothetical protein
MNLRSVGLIHWLAHKLNWNRVRLEVYRAEVNGKVYLMTECLKCGLKTFFILGCFASCVSTAQVVYNQLVAANCLAPSSDGVQAVSDEHNDPSEPPWLACMFDGGTVSSCSVPCQ